MWGNADIKFLILLLSAGLFYGCSRKLVRSHGIFASGRIESEDRISGAVHTEEYVPWEGENGATPIRTMRMNFHFMNSSDSSKNLSEPDGRRFAEDLIRRANKRLRENQPMRLPPGNTTAVLPPLLQFRIVEEAENTPAIYFHYDDENYYLIKKGKNQNNYDRKVIDAYGIGLDSVLNVFVQVPPPDHLMPEDYGGLINGIALRNAIKISGHLREGAEIWQFEGMFLHEIGHILGLRHSWWGDQCADTPRHLNCWNYTRNGSVCDSLVSNNVMDSNASQNAFTPCQIGIMQSHLSGERGTGRPFLDLDFCHKKNMPPYVVRDTVRWRMERDVVSDILIEKGGVLIISNRVSMASGARISVRKKGKLVLEKGARLHNACSYSWGGIYVRSESADIVMDPEGVIIENVAAPGGV